MNSSKATGPMKICDQYFFFLVDGGARGGGGVGDKKNVGIFGIFLKCRLENKLQFFGEML
jgi:hypothetical protein